MQPDLAQRVADTVERLLEIPPDSRTEMLHELCGEDQTLRAEVASLLGFQRAASTFIEEPAYQMAAAILGETKSELSEGEIIGNYRIISLIGEGGMGEVYLADDATLGRRVAIKLLKHSLGAAHLVRHFHQEERILADLTHPNIAQLYGSGVTPAGLPFFAMEYVDGPRLDEFCRQNQLSIPDRLRLFRKICSAVAYAHQRLVIHRDIKPANLRITKEGEPKLLDFGIAKLLDPDGANVEEMTMAAVMTLEYASPEQVRGETITTATDVYSLAVVLYELLTGQKPYKLKTRTPADIARAITEQEPTRPSSAAHNNPAAVRNPKSLAGDLDNIVLKAMRKEPSRRYTSVAEFSDDLRRHLESRPVVARRDTIGYRASKFVQRNKIAVSATILVALAILSGLVAALWQANIAREQRDLARKEKQKQEQVSAFLQEMLGAVAPEAKGVAVKVSDILDEASARAKAEADAQPAVMADVILTLGRTYLSLGLYDAAASNLRAALGASLKANGENHPTTATCMGWLGLTLAYQNNLAEGERISTRAVELQRMLHPAGDQNLGVALYALGLNLNSKGDSKAAEIPLKEATELIKTHFGKDHGYYISSLVMLAHAKENSGTVEEAESLYRRAIELGRGGPSQNRIFLAQATFYLGLLLIDNGDYAEAESALRESEQIYHQLLGDPNSNVPVIQSNLARLFLFEKDYVSAITESRQALELLPRFFAPDHYVVIGAKVSLGLSLANSGEPIAGERYLREALEAQTKGSQKDDDLMPFTESALGECLAMQQRYEEAEPLLLNGFEGMTAKLGETDPRVKEARVRLVKLYEAWGQPEKAARYR